MKGIDLINIAVGEFALPVPRTGNLELHSGFGRSAVEGREIHLRVQKKRAQADPLYQAEVQVSRIFERGEFRFQVSGRMDGIFRHEVATIEEIKTCFNVAELRRRLSCPPTEHPYCLQLLTYGYFYWLENGVVPRLTLHLVSSRNGRHEDLPLVLDPEAYREWLDARLDELVLEADRALKRSARRKNLAALFPFPFANPRPGQRELMGEIVQGMGEGRPMLIQAPTGLGKTVGVLHPVLQEALGRGQKVIYVTPKNSQHAVAEDALERFRECGAKLRSLSLTAKQKICLKEEPICTPDYCEYARDYYGKLARHGLLELIARKRRLKARSFRELGELYRLCPFELQIDSAADCDVVICDYNYVFAPRSALGRAAEMAVEQSGKPNLVVDEAHNLPARAMDYYSPRLSASVLEGMREGLSRLPGRFGREAEELLELCLRAVAACGGQRRAAGRIEPPVQSFLELDGKLRGFLTRYLESDAEILAEDPVLRLCYYWSEFAQILELVDGSEQQEFFATHHPGPGGGSVKITCCDASRLISDRYSDFRQVVGFSATLKPFDYYARLSGLDPDRVRTAEFQSPFPAERRKLLIIPQVSTRYSRRERNYARIAEVLRRIVELRPGNYLAFFPSFDFLERVAELLQPEPEGFTVLSQERRMTAAVTGGILDRLRAGDRPTLLLAVQGGSLSEGIDYAGEMVIGAFVVGPPLPSFDLEREEMRGYYQRRYQAGFEYAYTIPAMAKAVQSAGRVIRSETDRGIVVLMDDRFLDSGYSRSMPADWFDSDVSELVSGAILKEVGEFWQRVEGEGAKDGEGGDAE